MTMAPLGCAQGLHGPRWCGVRIDYVLLLARTPTVEVSLVAPSSDSEAGGGSLFYVLHSAMLGLVGSCTMGSPRTMPTAGASLGLLASLRDSTEEAEGVP